MKTRIEKLKTVGTLDARETEIRGRLLARIAGQIGVGAVEAAMSDPGVRGLVNFLAANTARK